MYQNPIQSQLQLAYGMIRQGQRHEALRILAPICREYPNNASAWWLAAHALDDPEQVKYALGQVLRVAPHYPGAREKLERLQQAATIYRPYFPTMRVTHGEVVYDSPRPQPVSYNPYVAAQARRQHQYIGALFSTLLLVVVGFGVLAVAVLFFELRDDILPQVQSNVESAYQTAEADQQVNGYLPGSAPQSIIQNPINSGALPNVATPDPTQFGETYWDGSGDGVTMEYLVIDGRYRRFYKFPIKLYVPRVETQVWELAINNALAEVNRVVPIERTYDPAVADVTLEILQPAAVQRRCVGLNVTTRVVGCGTIDYRGGLIQPVITGQALVATDTNNPAGTVLHELLHALGVVVHSPYADDVMYYQETQQLVTKLSTRDVNTMKRLYASPSYAD